MSNTEENQSSIMEENPAYIAMAWIEYQRNPSLLTGCLGEGVNVQDMTTSRPGMSRNEIHVKTIEDLRYVKEDFLVRPIVFKINVEHQRSDFVTKVVTIWKEDVAVAVNPKNPRMQAILLKYFNKAEESLKKGKNFTIKFDFAPSVREWYSTMVDTDTHCCGGGQNYDSGHMEVWITNTDTPMECIDNPWFIFCCCPMWCVMCGPFFLLNKLLTRADYSKDFAGFQVHFLSNDLTVLRLFVPDTVNYERDEQCLVDAMEGELSGVDAYAEREDRIRRVLAGDLLARPPSPVKPPVTSSEETQQSLEDDAAREPPPAYEEEDPARVPPPTHEEEDPARVPPPTYEKEDPARVPPSTNEEEVPARVPPPTYEEAMTEDESVTEVVN